MFTCFGLKGSDIRSGQVSIRFPIPRGDAANQSCSEIDDGCLQLCICEYVWKRCHFVDEMTGIAGQSWCFLSVSDLVVHAVAMACLVTA